MCGLKDKGVLGHRADSSQLKGRALGSQRGPDGRWRDDIPVAVPAIA